MKVGDLSSLQSRLRLDIENPGDEMLADDSNRSRLPDEGTTAFDVNEERELTRSSTASFAGKHARSSSNYTHPT